MKIFPRVFRNSCKYGIVKTITKEATIDKNIKSDLKVTLEHAKEMLEILRISDSNNINQKSKHL